MAFRENLREKGVRPLIKYHLFQPVDPHVMRVIDGPRYRQRVICETVFSSVKRTLGGNEWEKV